MKSSAIKSCLAVWMLALVAVVGPVLLRASETARQSAVVITRVVPAQLSASQAAGAVPGPSSYCQIVYPTPGQHLSNAVSTVMGVAGSSIAALAAVWCQVNNGAWTLATTTNNWTNWSANLSLAAGGNTIRAYAVDVGSRKTLYVGDSYNSLIRKITPAGLVTTLAGDIYDLTNGGNNSGYGDGPPGVVQFNYPNGTAVDAAGNVYVADYFNSLIRKITPAGIVTTLAGDIYDLTNGGGNTGYQDGPGLTAKFSNPTGVAMDNIGNVFVADQQNNLIRKITPDGTVSTYAGDTNSLSGGYRDGPAGQALFSNPFSLTVDGFGNVFVADSYNNLIRKITPDGTVSTVAGNFYYQPTTPYGGYADGQGTNAIFNFPHGIAVDFFDNLYVTDSGNNLIRKINPAGQVTTLAGDIYDLTNTAGYGPSDPAYYNSQPFADGPSGVANFNNPTGIAVDDLGNVFVADSANALIRKITPAGATSTLAGDVGDFGYADGLGTAAEFNIFNPAGVAVDLGGGAVSPTNSVTINYTPSQPLSLQVIGAGTVTPNYTNTPLALGGHYSVTASVTPGSGFVFTGWTVSSNWSGGVTVTTPALSFTMASNLTLTANFVDNTKPTLSLVAPATSQQVSNAQYTVTGRAGDNAGVAGVWYQFNNGPWTLAATTNNWTNWSAGLSLTPGNNVFRTYAVDISSRGILYVGDTFNDLIRKITPAGLVTTLAGDTYDLTNGGFDDNAGFSNGVAAQAQFYFPNGTAVDGAGNVYVADQQNNLIRKITPAGVVTTLAGDFYDLTNGNSNIGYLDGPGPVARFNGPASVAVDGAGNVYVSDQQNNLIRKITPSGVVSTLAGDTSGLAAGYADGAGSAARFNSPAGLALDGAGNLIVADSHNNLIRKITPAGLASTLAGDALDLTNQVPNNGYLDGPDSAAQFFNPLGVATDLSGNIYVSDCNNNLIREIGITGLVTTLAGDSYDLTNQNSLAAGSPGPDNYQYADGPAGVATFYNPSGMAVDDSGNVYVADSGHNLIRKISPAGVTTTLAGDTYDLTNNASNQGYTDGFGPAAKFNISNPSGLAVDRGGANVSPTNTMTLDYIPSATLQVQTIGAGTISPNYSNAVLALSNNYVVTAVAVPGSGFAFARWTVATNWLGGITTNNVALHFNMTSNLTLTATFVDTQKPLLTISVPTASLPVSNAAYTITGKASDNVAVSNVLYSLNGAAWTAATTTNYWTNWTAGVTLPPGTNVLAAYAVDTSGNLSTTSSVTFSYVVNTPLIVQTNQPGWGGISPNLNNTRPALNESYRLTATATPGFQFVNWTGNFGLATNSPTLTFTMVSNLVLTANFADVTKPSLSISTPTAGLSVSNAAYTIAGKASDNVAVSNVLYSLNGSAWTSAATSNNWAGWTAGVTLTPGPNTLQAYAVDTSGNLSVTSKVSFNYVVSAPLIVQTNQIGWGGISPNYNNALLAVNQKYTLTATAAAGFQFTHWTGNFGLVSNSPSLAFTMVSNLVLTANFADVTKPTLSISTPTAGLSVSNAGYTITGKTGDNVAVSNVLYSLNGSVWNPAATTNNWTNWTAGVTLTPGPNTLQAYAVDTSGNLSITSKVSFNYVVSAPLIVQTNQTGWGGLSPNYNNALLAVNQKYTLTATAAAGFKFTNWTSNFGLVSNSSVLTFTMQSNLVLTATFVDTQKPSLTIASPVPNQTITSNSFLIHGTTSDNAAVAGVWYQFNGGGWFNPVGTNNWSVTATLNPGTNTFVAYAVDTSGNVSPTNTVNFVYVDKTPVIVGLTGSGTLTPNYNGASLQIGQNYSMTAKPATGFAFTNWSSLQIQVISTMADSRAKSQDTTITTIVTTTPPFTPTLLFPSPPTYVTNLTFLTNNPTLTFAMTAGLDLEANFVDIAPPSVTITAPTANLRVSNSVYTAYGTASDNVGVSAVYYEFNNGGWQPAVTLTGNGSTSWNTPSLSLVSGTNTLQSYVVDAAGNISPTKSVSFVNLLVDPAPASLAGTLATVTPGDGSVVSVGFNAGTFSLTTAETNENYSVGTYSYTKSSPSQARLVFADTIPPGAGGFAVDLNFSAAGSGTYSNENDGTMGGISLSPEATLVPGSVANRKALFLNSGKLLTVNFGGGTLTATNTNGKYEADSFTFQPYSPTVALLTLVDSNLDTNYIVSSFLATNHGLFYSSSYDAEGNPTNTSFGGFVFPSTAVAPASLAGTAVRTTYGDGSTTTIGFGTTTYGQTSLNTNNDNDVGTYVYAKLNTTNALVTLTVAGPPTETNNGGGAFLTFVAPNFCLFTNQEDGVTGLSGLGLAPVASLVPASLSGATIDATNSSGQVTVITFQTNGKSNGSFTQIQAGSRGSAASSGTYAFTPYGPIGGMLKLTYQSPTSGQDEMAGDIGYVQVTFTQTQVGTFFVTFYDNAGDPPNIDTGVFSLH